MSEFWHWFVLGAAFGCGFCIAQWALGKVLK
jgi:hypothetical protein